MSERLSVQDLLFGCAQAQIVHVAARLGIADLLADGPKTCAQLAQATGAHEPSLYRLLRGLVCCDVVTEPEPKCFELTLAGLQLRSDVPDSLRDLVLLCMGDGSWRSWGELEYSVRTGQPSWDRITGLPGFEYWARHPEERVTFDAAMSNHTRAVAPALIAGYDFAWFGTLVDLGGGDGTLIAAILQAVPKLRGVLFDRPEGLESAPATLAAAGVADRCTLVTGNFFDSVPEGADAYLLKNIIHNWDDDNAIQILNRCREAMSDTARVLVVDMILGERIESKLDIATVTNDLNMMVLTGGRERTEQEFQTLYAAAGLEMTEILGPFRGYWIVIGHRSE